MAAEPLTTAESLATRLREARAVASDAEAQQRLETRIRRFEAQFGLSTGQMDQAIRCGDRAETAEISRWLIDAEALRRVRGR